MDLPQTGHFGVGEREEFRGVSLYRIQQYYRTVFTKLVNSILQKQWITKCQDSSEKTIRLTGGDEVDNQLGRQHILLTTMVGREFNNNYGGTLQAFALWQFLHFSGYYVEILDYNPSIPRVSRSDLLSRFKHIYRNLCKLFKKGGIKKVFFKVRKKVYGRITSEIASYTSVRAEVFKEFKSDFMSFTQKKYESFADVQIDSAHFLNQFEVFMVGSDQVWNPEMVNDDRLRVYLLGFLPKGKKVSYASSVSATIPDEVIELYRAHLQKFHAISVREKVSAEEIRKILGYTPVINADPTILLTPEEWGNVIKQPDFTPEKPFIFVYDLYRSEDILPVVEKLSRKDHFKYVNYDPLALHRKRYKNLQFNFYREGPSEFLWLIKESDFVVTSSFHGVVFSVLFKKPFYAILWNTKEKAGQNDRIIHFLSELGLEDRCTPNPKDLLKKSLTDDIDWTSVSEKLDELRGKSAQWLLSALDI